MSWDDLIEGRAPTAAPLTDVYREIRHIAPPEAPWPARLVAEGDDLVMLVDVDRLTDWRGWTRTGTQHVLAPLDVARRTGGHDAVLSWCVQPLELALRGRGAEGARSGGELVTLAVSLLRGSEEAWRGLPGDAASPVGRWWLTRSGRPVFIDGEGAAVEHEAARLVAMAAQRCTDRVLRPALDDVADALAKPRALRRTIETLEERLFEACAPQPFRPDDVGGATPLGDPVAGTAERALLRRDAGRVERSRARENRARTSIREMLERHVDGALAETVSAALDRTRRWVRSRANGKRAPWMVAGGVAVAVLVAGLVWPSDDTADPARALESTERHTSASPGARQAPQDAPTRTGAASADDHDGAADDDPVAIVARLLDGLEVCRATGDDACAAVRESSSTVQGGAALLPADERELALIEDYGGVAVVRAESVASRAAAQVVTVVADGDRWLIRDIRDME